MSERVPTTEQIRHAIDSGRTSEKVDHPDPAAAPLGTDDEAAGHTPTSRERKMAAKPQIIWPRVHGDYGIAIYLCLIAAIALAIIAARLLGA